MIRVRSVAPLDGYRLRVGFTDGSERVIDVERFLRGPMFEPVRRDRTLFEAVAVQPNLGAVVWPNGADIAPDVLYGVSQPARAEEPGPELTPAVRRLLGVAQDGPDEEDYHRYLLEKHGE